MYDDKLQRSCHLPAPGRNYMTHRQALQYFPDKSHESLDKNNKLILPILLDVLKMLSPCTHTLPIPFKMVGINPNLRYGGSF
jgi:hypothetical protein